MKTVNKFFLIVLLAVANSVFVPQKTQAQYASVSFQVFYDELSPYGTWVDYPEYGYVWMPSGMPGFVPYYSNGYWAHTVFGWMWVSHYPWGWAPFHYGRWFYDSFYGWIWAPDMYWGPAWVIWGYCDGYYGWAPLFPGLSIYITNVYTIPYQHWVFVPENHMGSTTISAYYGPRRNNEILLKKTTVVKNTYEDKNRNLTYVAGPTRQDVEQSTGKKFQPMALKEADKPGQKINNDAISIYRPEIKATDASGKKPAPEKVVNLKDRNPLEKKAEPKEQPKEIIKEIPEAPKDKTETPKQKIPPQPPAEPKQIPAPPPKKDQPRQEPPQVKPPKKEPSQNPATEKNPYLNKKKTEPYKPPVISPKSGDKKKGKRN